MFIRVNPWPTHFSAAAAGSGTPEHTHVTGRADGAIEAVEDRGDGDALVGKDVVAAHLLEKAVRSHISITGGRGRWKYRSPPSARRRASSSRHNSAPAMSMKFMLFAITSRCFGAAAPCAQRVQPVAHVLCRRRSRLEPSMRSSLSCGHSGSARARRRRPRTVDRAPSCRSPSCASPAARCDTGSPPATGSCRTGSPARAGSPPSQRSVAGRDRELGATDAPQPPPARRCRAATTRPAAADPAIAAIGIAASSVALTATSASSHNAANTAASGVRAPASRLGSERLSEPHDSTTRKIRRRCSTDPGRRTRGWHRSAGPSAPPAPLRSRSTGRAKRCVSATLGRPVRACAPIHARAAANGGQRRRDRADHGDRSSRPPSAVQRERDASAGDQANQHERPVAIAAAHGHRDHAA